MLSVVYTMTAERAPGDTVVLEMVEKKEQRCLGRAVKSGVLVVLIDVPNCLHYCMTELSAIEFQDNFCLL